MTYQDFILKKTRRIVPDYGLDIPASDLSPALFDFQRNVVMWALRAGRAALFLDTGLGKTICQVEWARHLPGNKLILAPLCVAQQTVREAKMRLNVDILHSRDGDINPGGITITNYERIDTFETSAFSAVVLDESSILKDFKSKTREALIERFLRTPYRLACTATPSPNDFTELGNHAEFLGVCTRTQMLSRYFVNDTSDVGTWRLKGHAIEPFWRWVATWAACASKPSDAGGDDAAYALPPITDSVHWVESLAGPNVESGELFEGYAAVSGADLHRTARGTMSQRCEMIAELLGQRDFSIIWCLTNDESALLAKLVPDSVQVTGSMPASEKEELLEVFSRGECKRIISKPSICGFGLNWQHAAHVAFTPLSYSFEDYYQAVRRSWRFGQKRPVHVDLVLPAAHQRVLSALRQKQAQHSSMSEMIQFSRFSSNN